MKWTTLYCLAAATLVANASADNSALELAGVTITPHVIADSMRYARDPEPADGARVQFFLRNTGRSGSDPLVLTPDLRTVFNGKSPDTLLKDKSWAWHDTPSAATAESSVLPSGAMTVWTFNGRVKPYGSGGRVSVEIGPERAPWFSEKVALETPKVWLSALTFLGPEDSILPDTLIAHIANETGRPLEIRSCRLWLPRDGKTPGVLYPREPITELQPFNGGSFIAPRDRSGFIAKTGPLPLTYTAVEVQVGRPGKDPYSIWGRVRIKPERFDISGGWVNSRGNDLAREVFLKTLKRLHVNTAHIAHTPGYSDTELYARYPLKYFNALTPFETYDTDEMLPRIHAVEFLGEPQYGGGRPVPPQEVWESLRPYAATRLATTVTHSEERIWRDYAGLSDYPHYDAYRVTAPSADAWRRYERWGEQRIGWGAPLETIGDLCRSLRELNRPMPCAVWSQGPHEGWDVYGGRTRTSPTPDEIRLQAYHAVSTRITSLYWFNLSLKSLVEWRDTLDELGRIGRELRLIDEFLLEGDAYQFERLRRPKGELDWDIASVYGPRAGLLFALDLDYVPDPDEKVFRFGPPRAAQWRFKIPGYFPRVGDVFRLDADGARSVSWSVEKDAIAIRDMASRVAIYVASPNTGLRDEIEMERQELIAEESALGFDPARNDADFQELARILHTQAR